MIEAYIFVIFLVAAITKQNRPQIISFRVSMIKVHKKWLYFPSRVWFLHGFSKLLMHDGRLWAVTWTKIEMIDSWFVCSFLFKNGGGIFISRYIRLDNWNPNEDKDQGPVSISDKTSYREIVKSRSGENGSLNYGIALKFDRHIGSSVPEVSVEFQSDRTILNTNLAASRPPHWHGLLHAIVFLS